MNTGLAKQFKQVLDVQVERAKADVRVAAERPTDGGGANRGEAVSGKTVTAASGAFGGRKDAGGTASGTFGGHGEPEPARGRREGEPAPGRVARPRVRKPPRPPEKDAR